MSGSNKSSDCQKVQVFCNSLTCKHHRLNFKSAPQDGTQLYSLSKPIEYFKSAAFLLLNKDIMLFTKITHKIIIEIQYCDNSNCKGPTISVSAIQRPLYSNILEKCLSVAGNVEQDQKLPIYFYIHEKEIEAYVGIRTLLYGQLNISN